MLAQSLTSQTDIPGDWLDVSYDDATRKITVSARYPFPFVYRHCVGFGSGVGVTAMGVRFSYARGACDYVKVSREAPYFDGRSIQIDGTPARFRQIQTKGIRARYVIELDKTGEIVARDQELRRPRLDDRNEVLATTYTLSGKVTKAEYFLPGETAPFYAASADDPERQIVNPGGRGPGSLHSTYPDPK